MKKIIKSLTPKSIKKQLLKHYTHIVKALHANQSDVWDAKIPFSQLGIEHMQHLKALPDREALLNVLPQGGVVAEIGVDTGDFSETILAITKPVKLHLIDAWSTERYHQGKQELVATKFANGIANASIEMNLGYSTTVGETFPDAYFDWVYIDTDHSYKTTLAELKLYSKKVKPNGIIAGHDFITGNWRGLVKYGVMDAVYEFCKAEDWEFIYLTMEHKAHPSFAIRRILNNTLK